MDGAQGSGGEPARAGELLERERELGVLREAIASAAAGAGMAIVLEGAPGLGKSRLLHAAGQMAEVGGVGVLRARCQELERALPWPLARSLLAPALARMPATSRRRALKRAGDDANELFAAGHTPRHEAPDQARLLRRAHALTWLTADLAARAPLALLIDDLHWADEPSLHFIAHLCARAGELPVTLILARRPPEQVPGRASAIERIAGQQATRTIELKPLSAAAVERLVCGALGATGPELIAACSEVTAGNPFYLHELLRELAGARADGQALDASAVRAAAPAEIVRSVRLRLGRLGPAAAALAGAVAVLGGDVCMRHAAELAELQIDDAAAALDALAGAEILLADDPLGFVHPLVARAVYEDLGVSRRQLLHLRAGRMLARDRFDLAHIAVQLLAGGRRGDPWVVDTLREAAHNALDQGAGELAADCLARALQEPPAGDQRAALLAELGRVEASLGRPAASEHLRCALELTSEPSERAQLMLELGRALAVTGDHVRATEMFERGATTLADPHSELGRELRAWLWMSETLDLARRSQTATAATATTSTTTTSTTTTATTAATAATAATATTAATVAATAEPTAEPPEVEEWREPLSRGQRQLLAQLAQQRAFEGGSPQQLRALAERAWGGGELLRAEGCDGLTWSLVTGALVIADELERELEICSAVIEDARIHGSPMAYATACYCRSWPLLHRGQIDDALADAQSALRARADGWATFVGAATSAFVLACVERGAVAEARAALAPVLADPRVQSSSEYVLVMWAHARVLLAEDSPSEALEILLATGELLGQAGVDQPAMMPWRADASCAAGLLGDEDRALSLAEAALVAARASGIPRVVAGALRARSRVERGQQAIASLREALSLLPAALPRLERAHVLVELGAALRRSQRRTEARAPLREGRRLAQAGGARVLAELATAELLTGGAQLGARAHNDGTAALTPSERRVARLAAEGHSNREIAQHLFVTVKTVEYHLGNAYRKLDIKRRGQLARMLSEPASGEATVGAM